MPANQDRVRINSSPSSPSRAGARSRAALTARAASRTRAPTPASRDHVGRGRARRRPPRARHHRPRRVLARRDGPRVAAIVRIGGVDAVVARRDARPRPLAAGPPRPAARGALARASALSPLDAALPDLASSPALVAEVADGLEGGIQAIYLGALLSILGFAGFIVVRQVFIRRELDASAKAMGERIRSGDATAEEYFEMGSIMLRKKVYTQAVRNLKLAAERWEGDKEDLAQIHNALGFGYLSTEKFEESVAEFKTAVELQPGYVTAWNNLGDALERMNDRKGAMAAYEESLVLSPGNQVAENRLAEIKRRLSRLNQL